MWTPEIVRSRFVEACDTERRLPKGGGSTSGGFWPAYVYSFEDMNGWGTKRLAEEREMRMARIPPSAAAISRFEEVMTWSASMIHDDTRRKIIWTWAYCQMSGHSFAARCKKLGWVKMTAYRRLHAVSDAISRDLVNDLTFLRMPDEKWVRQPDQGDVHICSTLENSVTDEPGIAPSFFMDEKPRHTLSTPSDIAEFAGYLEKVNEARRKARIKRIRRMGGEKSVA